MVEFTLPKNSVIGEGKVWPKPEGATNLREFRIYRFNPDDDANPRTASIHWLAQREWMRSRASLSFILCRI